MIHFWENLSNIAVLSSKHTKRSSVKKTWHDVDSKVFYRELKSLARNIKTNPHNIIL